MRKILHPRGRGGQAFRWWSGDRGRVHLGQMGGAFRLDPRPQAAQGWLAGPDEDTPGMGSASTAASFCSTVITAAGLAITGAGTLLRKVSYSGVPVLAVRKIKRFSSRGRACPTSR